MNTLQIAERVDAPAVINFRNTEVFRQMGIDPLLDHLINVHHRFAKQNAETIYDLAQKVSYRHRENHPELARLAAELFLFLDDLLNHLKREEEILFPIIRQLSKRRKHTAHETSFGFIMESLKVMQKEQVEAKRELKLLRELTIDYEIPPDACDSYRHLFEKLEEYEDRLIVHFHIENNVLFPRVAALDAGPETKEREDETW